ncbi:integral membrane protein [Pedobacter sp. W3I1]|uniref:DUF3817 domain-containing protein n=1 Tax=Pedobacter sp. W3I1 TaxID=3042291 RepID=UPI00278633E6|nr:DUF3817 domain-containing protein [Pedobacter sp. W3I1]MDQ0640004.1 integral membrane protein [Pedobacter sp. W3I1]
MTYFFKTQIGRLRLVGYLEGISLLVLIFVAVPLKHYFNDPRLVKNLGPIHGALFLLFIFLTISVGVEEKWKFKDTTWKILLACVVPFGTFYIDRHILQHTEANQIGKDEK